MIYTKNRFRRLYREKTTQRRNYTEGGLHTIQRRNYIEKDYIKKVLIVQLIP